MTHVLQISGDSDVFSLDAAQDSRARQAAYAKIVADKHPGARLSNVVIAAKEGLNKEVMNNLILIPMKQRKIRHIPSLLLELFRLHREKPVTVVTTQDIHGIYWAGVIFAKLVKVPAVGQIHYDLSSSNAWGELVPKGYAQLYKRLTLWALKKYEGLRVVNSDTKKYLRNAGYDKRIEVAPVPVSTHHVAGKKKGGGNVKPRVLYVGRLEPVKNLDLWMRTARAALDIEKNMEFVIVGDGSERGRLEEMCDELKLRESVLFTGPLRPAQVKEWYESSDILLLTSNSEGFGRVLVEAMSNGVTPVSSISGGPKDIVDHGVTGYLGEATENVLAQYVVDLARNPDKLKRMSARAKETASNLYSAETLRRKWMDYLLSFAGNDAAKELGGV